MLSKSPTFQAVSYTHLSPTVVAGGMKVALITTIFGLIVALILQVFYNYIPVSYTHLDVYKRQYQD